MSPLTGKLKAQLKNDKNDQLKNKLRSQKLQSYKSSAPEQLEDEIKINEPTMEKCYPSSSQKSEFQTSISHCCKEQRRRLQIRTSCQHLCDLLPFVNGQLDIADTLELTANYIS
ncbi:spermatogenesis- and oogenesis-specific basic helix-loop-helix-containing protein 2-like [Simochromis diagramma]|uniref:spermatogenesis- and oogenesis-specific basic helix-loop-helix-containing protein 2-like n=1 Tax=Simochromis diagramma TaxID=43689 RepID=UPI001A7ECC8F|nr:spermatogenesis- and oogenesis-specific basic helix-loop-helix-containing protein 2-like [Simochromis diagramma]